MRNMRQGSKFTMIAVVLSLMPWITSQALAKPLKVFILAGQSNMQGHANVSTFDSMADDPKTAPLLKEIRNADGTPRVCQKVWISSIGCAGDDTTEQKGKLMAGFGASPSEIGPEFTFGIYMEKLLGEPILIIKTSWGGRSLNTDFRPPSAGLFVWNDTELLGCKNRGDDLEKDKADKIKATGVYYRLMIEHVRKVLADIKRVVPEYDPKQGYELVGFVWFQGFNDLVNTWTYDKYNQPGGYDLYAQLLTHFIRDVRKDLNVPALPFVIGVMGIGGVKEGEKPGSQKYFRQAQVAPTLMSEFKGNVVAVQTAPYWDDDLETLRTRLEALWPKMDARAAEEVKKNPKMTGTEVEAAKMKVVTENFTPEEQNYLNAASNGGYHYLGAAKILAPIGKAFAEAMANFHGKKPAPMDAQTLLEKGRTSDSLPEGMVVRICACLGEPVVSPSGTRSPEPFTESWEFASNQVHRVEFEYKDGKSADRRTESRPFDSKDLCRDLLEGKAIEIQARKGEGPRIVLAGAPFERGSRSIEVVCNGETILDLHETNGPAFDAYRESDARAFGALYEMLASQARAAFRSKADEVK